MNRRSFFKFLGIGAAAAAVAPKMLTETKQLSSSVPNIETEGTITFFEQPREGYDYSIGVETGDGRWENPSIVSVMRVGNGNEPCEQVAEYESVDIGERLATNIAYIAKLYGEKCIDIRGPMIVIEQVTTSGDTIQALLKIMGVTRFYKAVSAKGIKRDGWYTMKSNRYILMERFTTAVDEGWYKPKSPDLRFELSYIGMHGSKNSIHPFVRAAAQSYVGGQDQIVIYRDNKNASIPLSEYINPFTILRNKKNV